MPARTRDHEQHQQEQKERFLRAVAKRGTLTAGCRAARVSPHTVYQWREFDETFVIREHEAREACADSIEEALLGRALKRSDIAGMFLLKALRPEKYRERFDMTTAGEPIVKAYVGVDLEAV